VTPAYNESDNLPLLHARLTSVLEPLGLDWEWIIVDDHSADRTFAVVADLAGSDPRVRGLRFARNSGSHLALSCGLDRARGRCAIVMAADLQDPPETIPTLLARWESGDQVVWAVRARREGETRTTIRFSRLYYWIMRHIVGIRDMPSTGADFFLVDRRVLDAFNQFRESNTSIMALITWMGFRQGMIHYDKQARVHGRSGWSLRKKLKLVVDSVTSFTYVPIRMMSYIGFMTALIGFLYAAFIIINALLGRTIQGWSSLMVVTLVIGGLQMMMLGVLGEYLWRALDEARRRPRFLIEATTEEMGPHGALAAASPAAEARG
jgi:dolichol-phosphate mannosyltransferase